MCLAWTTPASLVETVACQGQQRYLAKHQLRPPKCSVSSGPVHPQTWLRLQAAFVAGARCRAFRHYSWVGCFATALNCYMAVPLLPTMSFRCLRGSRFCSSCSSSSSSCGWADRDSAERGDGGAEAPGTFFFAINLGSCEFESQEDEASWLSKNPWGLEWLELGMIFLEKLDRLENFVLCDVTDKVVGQSTHLIALWIFAPPRCYLAFCRSYPRHISTWNGVTCLDIFSKSGWPRMTSNCLCWR